MLRYFNSNLSCEAVAVYRGNVRNRFKYGLPGLWKVYLSATSQLDIILHPAFSVNRKKRVSVIFLSIIFNC